MFICRNSCIPFSWWSDEKQDLSWVVLAQVIVLAAQELSQPITNKSVASSPVTLVSPLESSNDLKHWRQVVEERIESKTRRFRKVRVWVYLSVCLSAYMSTIISEIVTDKMSCFLQGPSKPPPKATPNLYAPVAGYFFFPLLRNYDRWV